MKTILNHVKKEIIIKRSRFITQVYYVNDIEDIKKILANVSSTYKDATHNCYAYICETHKKACDDGEPSGTAGMPILNILEANELDHVLAVVTRYFGGIKLGSNGLIRAYADSVKEALSSATIVTLKKGLEVKIIFTYNQLKQVDYLLSNYEIIDRQYKDNITYIVKIPKDEDIKNLLTKYLISYEVMNEIFILQK